MTEHSENDKIDCPLLNPLELRFNNILNIKISKYIGCDFKLVAIEEYNRYTDGCYVFIFTDYILKDRNNSKDHFIKLRVVDTDVLVLEKFYSKPWDNELLNKLTETAVTKTFTINYYGKEFVLQRVNNLENSWKATTKKFIDGDITINSVAYWDFWRDVDNEHFAEMFFVELNEDTIEMWCGIFVNPEDVLIL